VDGRRTLPRRFAAGKVSPSCRQRRRMADLQPIEIELLIKIHRKRSMGWLIALDEPIFNKPTKAKEALDPAPYYDYVI
jgi:hypothetical protein